MMIHQIRSICLLASLALLPGCVSLGPEPPTMLMTLTAQNPAAMNTGVTAQAAKAILVAEPQAPQKINVTRIPVQIDNSRVAYLKGGVWVEKPSRLFRALLAETLRAQTDRLVLDREDPALGVTTRLRGTLREFGYDAPSASAVVQYDAIQEFGDGVIRTRRFEHRIEGVLPEYVAVGEALNRAANVVAADVASWAN